MALFLNLMNTVLATPLPAETTTVLITSIPLIIIGYQTLMRGKDLASMDRLLSIIGKQEEVYDFVVVGGGSAGAALAARLSDSFPKTLLLEAGTDPHPLTYVPSFAGFLVNQPLIDWKFETEKFKNSGYGLVNQRAHWPAGRSLGGTSNTNFMIYNRGNPEDYNYWANHTGDSRWAYASVEKIFNRIEDYHGNWKDRGYHTTGGPMSIEPATDNPSTKYWLEAGKELGFNISDPNEYQTQLFSPMDLTTKRGTRFSTFEAYIKPAESKNLKIYRYALATKIHFDENKHAYGVTYHRHGKSLFVRAAKEIIICGGAINTAKLLMLSGIGPKHHLSDLGIHVVQDLPVGVDNLQDHLTVVVGPFLLNQNVSVLASRDVNLKSAFDFATEGKGAFSGASPIGGMGLFSTSTAPANWPNIFYIMTGLGIHATLGQEFEAIFGFKKGLMQEYLGYNAGNDSNIVGVTLGRPKSQGWVRLRDKNPFSPPLIQPNYLSDEKGEDIRTMVAGIQKVVKVFETTDAYGKLGARLAPNHLPGCGAHKLRSAEYWECYVRTVTQSIFHNSCTCRMGKPDDPTSVTDSQLRVLGTTGLRLADASVMPAVTNSNTNLPAVMIGEMCSDIIKEEWADQASSFEGDGPSPPVRIPSRLIPSLASLPVLGKKKN